MTFPRIALGVLAIASALAALYLGTSDVHTGDRNCGTAVLRVDTNQLVIESGDSGDDQFTQDALVSDCDQLILRQRFLSALPAAVAFGAVVAGRRLRDRRRPPPGDIFGRVR